jgi:hypothetical protein
MADDRRGKSLFFRNQDLPSWPFFFLARKTVGPFFPAKKAVLIPNGSAKKAVVGKKKKRQFQAMTNGELMSSLPSDRIYNKRSWHWYIFGQNLSTYQNQNIWYERSWHWYTLWLHLANFVVLLRLTVPIILRYIQ